MRLCAGRLRSPRRMCNRGGVFDITAIDHRPPIEGPIAKHRGVNAAPWEQVARVKRVREHAFRAGASAAHPGEILESADASPADWWKHPVSGPGHAAFSPPRRKLPPDLQHDGNVT